MSLPPRPSLTNSARATRRLTPSNSSKGDSSRSAAATPKYWRAISDTTIFSAPYGRPVGDVEEGTVVRESTRYIDCFDDMWMAVDSEESNSGLLWVRRYGTGALQQEKTADWEPVAEAEAAAAAAPGSTVAEPDIPPLDVTANVLDHPLQLVTSDLVYYQYFLDNKLSKPTDRPWNQEYQSCVEDLLFKHTDRSVDSRQAMETLLRAFADEVEEVAHTITKENFLPLAKKTIMRHPTAVDVYFHNNVMYRLAVDTTGGYFGGDQYAVKVASQFHKAQQRIAHAAPLCFLAVPMTIVMTVGGFRLWATSIPPVSESSVVVGKCGTHVGANTGLPLKLLNTLGQQLGLKPHAIDSLGFTSFFPCDAQVVAGKDHRLYVLNTARLMPPAAPTKRHNSYHPLTTPLYERIRPEVMDRCGRPLNPDAFVPRCTDTAANEDMATITQWLRDEGIPDVAAMLSILEPVEFPEQESATCSRCAREVDNELRFGICRSEAACCFLCSNCYVDLLKLDHFEQKAEEVAKQLQQAVKCGGLARALKGAILTPDVTTLFHSNCLNMRFLPYVYHRLAESAVFATAHFLEIEMIARSAKHLLWQKLRLAQTPAEIHTLCGSFFQALLQPDGDMAEAFWANELGPMIQNRFDIFSPFNTSELDIELVCTRVSELTGVDLTEASLQSLHGDSPFVQLKLVHPVMKSQRLPWFVSEVGEHQSALKGTLEELLLFWIGQGQVDPEWEAMQPKHLQEKF